MNKIIYSVLFAFILGSCTTTQVQNAESEPEMETTTQGIDRSIRPTPGPAPKVNIGKPQTFTLDNGLKVMVVENNKLPRVSFNLVMDNPPVAEGDKKGVRSMLSSMMGNGTSKIPKDKFNEEVDFYGANVSFHAGGAYASTLSKYFPQILDLVSQGVLDPLLTKEEFESEKAKMIEGLKADEKSVTSVASNVQDALVFGKSHPFGEFLNDKTAPNITFKDVKDYYDKNFVPGNAYMVVVGDVSFDEVKNLVSKKFNPWKKATVKAQNYPEPKNLATATINFVDMPNAVQSEVSTLNVTNLKMSDPDYFAALMANQILGGGGEGRLFLNLREANGWTYGSYSRIRGDKDVNRFMTTASVRNSVTDSAIVEMLGELGRIRTELVSEEELKNAKAKFVGNFVMQVEKPEVIARQALQIETQNLPADFYENYIRNINAVTREDVMAAAKKYFGKDNARIVVVGKAEDVLPALQKMNLPIKYYNRYAEEVEAPKFEKVAADVTPMSVVNTYLDKIGGKDKVKALKSVKATFSMEAGAPQPLEGTLLQLAPNREKTEMKMNGMTVMSQSFDGTTLKVAGMGGSQELTGDDVADKVAKKGIIDQAFYTADQLELAGLSKVNGKDAYKVKVKVGKSTHEEFYDKTSGLLVQSVATQETPQGDMQIVSKFEDYKAVDGIKMPFKVLQEVGPQTVVMEMKSYEVNKGVSQSDF